MEYNYIKNNIDEIENNIVKACKKHGRNREDVKLMAVSKMQSIEKLQIAKNCGLNLFGENKVQEFQSKADFFKNNNAECHLIGSLQTNKVKFLPVLTDFIQSVDSEKLLLEIQKHYEKTNKIANILLQINIANEDTKGGIPSKNTIKTALFAQELKNIKLRGLMCIPQAVTYCGEDKLHFYFEQMQNLFTSLKNEGFCHLDTLSMGMSDDYEIAIEHGSTLIRVGSAIFGERQI